jgi:hypothetical protein
MEKQANRFISCVEETPVVAHCIGEPMPILEVPHDSEATSPTPSERSDIETAAGVCTPGQYWCHANYEWIVVCDAAGIWQYSSYCGKTSSGHGW